ncbi:MAG TPA: histidine phosphatase family protein [Ktedonobacterales bacterium]
MSESSQLPNPFEEALLSPKLGGTELYFIRHADALPGADEVVRGHYDEQPLSELGRKQAGAVAERLRGAELNAVYSAPLGRARATAEAIAAAAGLTVRVDAGLREVELGTLEAEVAEHVSAEEFAEALRKRLREIATIALANGGWSTVPGAEPSAALRARLREAVAAIVARHAGERVALVTHAGSINAWFADALGIQHDYFFPTANTAISLARVRGDAVLVFALNDISHLRAAGLTMPGI